MMRALALAGGITACAGFSQFPEYSQQYYQRLSGAVDELAVIVADFDRDATSLGLDRGAAIQQLELGSAMGEARALSMSRVFKRHDRLSEDLSQLQGRTSLERAFTPWRFTEPKLAQETLADFRPAVPLTFEGIGFAAMGLAVGYGLISIVFGFLANLFRRKDRAPQVN